MAAKAENIEKVAAKAENIEKVAAPQNGSPGTIQDQPNQLGNMVNDLLQHFPDYPKMKQIRQVVKNHARRRTRWSRMASSDKDKCAELVLTYDAKKDALLKEISELSDANSSLDYLRLLAQILWERNEMTIYYLAFDRGDVANQIQFNDAGYTEVGAFIYTPPINDLHTSENENHPVMKAIFTLLSRFAKSVPAETEKIINTRTEKWEKNHNLASVEDLEFIILKKAHAVSVQKIRLFFRNYKNLKKFNEDAKQDYYEIGIALLHRNIALEKLQDKIYKEKKNE